MKQGQKPTLEEIADEAEVSRATAYRYFPSVDALVLEAGLDVVAPRASDVLAGVTTDDPVVRLERVDTALHQMIAENEVQLRLMLANSLQQRAKGTARAMCPCAKIAERR